MMCSIGPVSLKIGENLRATYVALADSYNKDWAAFVLSTAEKYHRAFGLDLARGHFECRNVLQPVAH